MTETPENADYRRLRLEHLRAVARGEVEADVTRLDLLDVFAEVDKLLAALAAEREACAGVADLKEIELNDYGCPEEAAVAADIARGIRARGVRRG